MSNGAPRKARAIAYGLIYSIGPKKVSSIEIEIEWPSVICIDCDSDFELDYPKYVNTILER